MLVDEKKIGKADVPWESDGYKPATKEFIDGIEYDGRKPNAYIDQFAIGLKGKQKIEGGDVK
jgi:nitrate/nitrite transport system substrate-binding protein